MANTNAIKRAKEVRSKQLPVLESIIEAYKLAGYKVINGIETVMIEEKGTTFRIFISRISHSVQLYYLGEWQFTKEYSAIDLQSPDNLMALESSYKELFG